MRARSDLGDVQRRIRLLEQAIAENEATHSEAERERARTERAVTAARRTLHDTAAALLHDRQAGDGRLQHLHATENRGQLERFGGRTP